MSIASKHAYRFGYLKSDKWKSVRLDALVREGGKCEICKEESIYNDAHHIWYPANVYDTTPDHLAILCRACHDFVHVMLPECKTKDETLGRAEWMKLRNAIIAWRTEKLPVFKDSEGIEGITIKRLHQEIDKASMALYVHWNKHRRLNKSDIGMIMARLKKLNL